MTVVQAHRIGVAAEHALIHAVPRLTAATVHSDHTPTGSDPHGALAHCGELPGDTRTRPERE